MKNLISVVVGGALGFAAAYMVLPKAVENPKCAPVAAAAKVTEVSPAVLAGAHLDKLTQLNPTATKSVAMKASTQNKIHAVPGHDHKTKTDHRTHGKTKTPEPAGESSV
ncbi:MAG: hypothetical protein NTZ16_05210, partial [Verrucomicrobia bacterium]|nr:hypothetical protein [Verrucomicrobiota bacterium]